jgi:hypothetical protein
MFYFKYCPPRDLHFGMLSRGEVFFASPDELNDGSECRPRYILRGTEQLWNRLSEMILLDTCCYSKTLSRTCVKSIMSLALPLGSVLMNRVGKRDMDLESLRPVIDEELPPLLKSVKLDIPTSAIMDLVDLARSRMFHYLKDPLYIASFSRTPLDPTMWGHYGGAERGFCIVFNVPDRKLRILSSSPLFWESRPSTKHVGVSELGPYTSAEVKLKSVMYRSAPLRFNAFHRLIPHFSYSEKEFDYDLPLLLPGEVPSRQEELFGLVKAKTWKYEQEERAFLPSIGKLTPEARCVRYSWTQIAGVIFGPQMKAADMERVIVCCHLLDRSRRQFEPRSNHFLFLQASQRSDSFQMHLSAVGVLDDIYAEHIPPIQAINKLDSSVAAGVAELMAKIQGGDCSE